MHFFLQFDWYLGIEVRNHCWEPLEKSELNDIQLFLISAFHLNRYDGPKLLSCLLNKIDHQKKRKFSIQDGQYLIKTAFYTMS